MRPLPDALPSLVDMTYHVASVPRNRTARDGLSCRDAALARFNVALPRSSRFDVSSLRFDLFAK